MVFLKQCSYYIPEEKALSIHPLLLRTKASDVNMTPKILSVILCTPESAFLLSNNSLLCP